MNKNILETLISNSFNLTTRKGFSESNKGQIIPLNFNLACDLAYIRMRLKRKLVEGKYSTIVLRDNRLNNTRITVESFINLNSLQLAEQCDKVLKSITNWCNITIEEGSFPEKIILE
jgi:hypothetical protein